MKNQKQRRSEKMRLRLLFPAVILSVFLIIYCLPAVATTYYISSSGGNDNSPGKGKSPATALRTLSMISKLNLKPGDSVLLKRGDLWRETIKVPASGTTGAFITFSSYGTGANPLLYGSEAVSGWKKNSANVWISVNRFEDPHPNSSGDILSEIFFIGNDKSVKWGSYRPDAESLVAEFDWTWNGRNILIYSSADPASAYGRVEVPQRTACIDLNGREYISVSSVDLSFSKLQGITYKYPMTELSGLKIENCKICYIGGNIKNSGRENGFGIDAVYSGMNVSGCEIHNCGRRGISLCLYASGFVVKNILIERNYFHDGHHTTGVDISAGSKSFTAGIDGVTIRRNLFTDQPASPFLSEQIFIQNQKAGDKSVAVKNINIYSNIFKYPSHSAIMTEGGENISILNNTFYNHNTSRSITIAHVWIDTKNTSVKVKNNIFYTELNNDTNVNGLEMYSKAEPAVTDADYNLYYRINSKLRMIFVGSTGYTAADYAKVRSVYNWEKHSPAPSDPLFVSSDDFHLRSGSPAIGKGTDLQLPMDFYGKKFKAGNPSIGACEYEALKPGLPLKGKK
jgi:hypothetical protein